MVSYETFEIIMDRLEKEYFDLVRPLYLISAFLNFPLRRPRIFPNLIMPCLLRIQPVLFVMIQKEKIAMLLYFVTVATSLFIKVFS